MRVAKERRAARSAPNAAPRQASPSFEAADEAAPAAHVTSLSDALSEALGLKPGAALTAPGQTVADLIKVSVATAHPGPCHDRAAAPPCSIVQQVSQLQGVPASPHARP